MDYSKIGKVQNTHGLEGKMILSHILNSKSAFQKLDHLFIEIQTGSFIPFFFQEKKPLSPSEILVKIEEVDSVEEARKLLNKGIYIENNIFQQLRPKNVALDFIGYSIIDQHLKNLGKIQEIMETPGQVLASVLYQEKEILVPLIDQTIVSVDPIRKEIIVDLPDGLIDLYLSN